MSNKNLLPVYAPGSQEPEYHTRLNAYDLVNGAGYTWKAGSTHETPAALTPHQGRAKGLEPAQAVINNAGAAAATAREAADANDEDDEDEVIVPPPAAPAPAEEPVVETPAAEEAPAPAAAPAARGRGKPKA